MLITTRLDRPDQDEFKSLRNYFTSITLCSEGDDMGLPNELVAVKCGRGDYIEIVSYLFCILHTDRLINSCGPKWAYEREESVPNSYRVYNANSGRYLAYADPPQEGDAVTLNDDGSLWELRADIRPGVKS